MSMSDAEYAEYRKDISAEAMGQPPNFISDVFFLAVRFLRLSYIYNVSALQRLARHQGELRAHLERLPQHLPSGTPAAMREMLLKRVTAQLAAVEDGMRLVEVWAFDEGALESVHLLVTLLLQYLLKQAKCDLNCAELIPRRVPSQFKALPEYLVECAAEWAVFVGRTLPQFWLRNGRQLDALLAFVVAFLDRPDGVKNPYLRSKWVELLHGWAASEAASRLFAQYPVLVHHLPGKLMRFYVEAERTGTASQFYDKFNIRFHVAVILRCLWEQHAALYRPRIVGAAEDRDTFIHFINYLLNDTSYLLDEATAKLAAIQRHQHDQDRGELGRLGEEERRQREEGFEAAQRHCVALTQLARETLHMLAYLTEAIRAPFLQAEVVDHLAAMLNYDLRLLAGPTSGELKVRDPARYHFEPRAWLGSLLKTYLHLAGEAAFRAALARDERSFDPAVFERAAGLMGRLGLGTGEDITAFQRLAQQVIDLRTASAREEADLGDIPDAFLDPLMFTLMEDPVTLATSGVTVDRKTIVAHLLNHQVDPFNRMPITMEQVRPNEGLKADIEAFLAERRKQK
jgi:ubiquitin conjugation factor E4 B